MLSKYQAMQGIVKPLKIFNSEVKVKNSLFFIYKLQKIEKNICYKKVVDASKK